jgi:galactokinase
LDNVRARAPGRVNLIGEHTDYNGGYVLPTILPQNTCVDLRPRAGRRVRARSLDLDPESLAEFEIGSERRQGTWIDYVQGVTWAVHDRATRLAGFDLVVTSSVPIGKGLSSSASLEIAVARALNSAYGLGMTDVEIALLAHHAETAFVGAPVGVMDHMVCSLGKKAHALFLDVATMEVDHIPVPGDLEIGVIDSGLSHSHASGEYRTRRRECDEAAALLGVRWLRDVHTDDLPRVSGLPEPLNRRARHVLTENSRVLAAVDALRRGDDVTLGSLLLASHASMRDDFEISTPEIDRLVDIAARDPDTFGARMTGGGFGGAIVVMCAKGQARSVTDRTVTIYREATARDGRTLVPATP